MNVHRRDTVTCVAAGTLTLKGNLNLPVSLMQSPGFVQIATRKGLQLGALVGPSECALDRASDPAAPGACYDERP